jgi:hypothetical protein
MNAFLIIPAFGLFIGALVWRTRKAQIDAYNKAAGDEIQAGIDALDDCHCHTGDIPDSVKSEIICRDFGRLVSFKSASKN